MTVLMLNFDPASALADYCMTSGMREDKTPVAKPYQNFKEKHKTKYSSLSEFKKEYVKTNIHKNTLKTNLTKAELHKLIET